MTHGPPPPPNPVIPLQALEQARTARLGSLRPKTTTWNDRVMVASDSQPEVGLHVTVRRALSLYRGKAMQSIVAEMMQLHEKPSWTPQKMHALTSEQLKRVIPCSIFLKEKFLSTGEFEKLKARLVAGGHRQDKSIYDDISSPTVSTTGVFMVASIAAAEGRKVTTVDITGAYLNAKMGKHRVLMRLDPLLAGILVGLYPERYRE
jgi:hypothetical protein